MFDIEAEASFVQSCMEALEGRTVIFVTHRPASLVLADRIVSVEDGICRELTSEEAAALDGTAV